MASRLSRGGQRRARRELLHYGDQCAFLLQRIMHEAYGQAATNESLESAETVLMSATDPDTVRQ